VARQLLVYVQALPVFSSVPSSAKRFQDLETCEFKMSHSSKAALSFATALGFHEIVAVGFSPILRESIARGATSCRSVPLCDDPLEQASFFPRESKEGNYYSHIIIGENPEWVFGGGSLAGTLCESRKMRFRLFTEGGPIDFPEDSIILVKDSGEATRAVDVRRIKSSFDVSVNPEGLLGGSTLSKREGRKGESLKGDTSEITSTLVRKLRRITNL
jgi:hypothetical protein